jgi:hypothetical protein
LYALSTQDQAVRLGALHVPLKQYALLIGGGVGLIVRHLQKTYQMIRRVVVRLVHRRSSRMLDALCVSLKRYALSVGGGDVLLILRHMQKNS